MKDITTTLPNFQPQHSGNFILNQNHVNILAGVTRAYLTKLYLESENCKYCGIEMTCLKDMFTARVLDHKKPRSKGGKHEPQNLQFICWLCNLIKSDFLEKQFIQKYILTGKLQEKRESIIKNLI